MARRILWALLALAPATILVDRIAQPGETTLFVLAAAALIPLAWLIGESTEHAAEHTGPGIGGYLNASFGNAPELIIALVAVGDGLFGVVLGSLAGSTSRPIAASPARCPSSRNSGSGAQRMSVSPQSKRTASSTGR